MEETRTNRFKCFSCAATYSVRVPKCTFCGDDKRIVNLDEWRKMTTHTLTGTRKRRTTQSRRPSRPTKLMDELGIKSVK